MYLYIVDYKCYEPENDAIVPDRWFLGAKDHVELEEAIKEKSDQLKEFGYEVTGYGYQLIHGTDNWKEIFVK